MKNTKNLMLRYSSQIMYLFFGVLTTLINVLVFVVAIKLGFQTSLANILAWSISVLFAYATNRIWVFESKVKNLKSILIEMAKFFFYRILTLGIDIAIVDFGVKILNQNAIIWKLIDNVVVIILNYVFSKVFIFREKDNSKSY